MHRGRSSTHADGRPISENSNVTPPAKTNSEELLAERGYDGTTLSSPDLPVAASARRGVTLIEAVLFIAVALGLIIGGLVFYRQAAMAAQTQEFIRLTNAIVAEARVVYGRERAFDQSTIVYSYPPGVREALVAFYGEPWVEAREIGGLPPSYRADSVLVSSGSIPAQNFTQDPVNGVRLVSPWNTRMSTTVSRVDYESTLVLDLTDVPVSICTRVAPMDAAGRSVLADKVFVFGTLVGEVTPSQAATFCRSSAGTGSVVPSLRIGIRL